MADALAVLATARGDAVAEVPGVVEWLSVCAASGLRTLQTLVRAGGIQQGGSGAARKPAPAVADERAVHERHRVSGTARFVDRAAVTPLRPVLRFACHGSYMHRILPETHPAAAGTPGALGVFATAPIPAQTFIVHYAGVVHNRKE